MSNFNMPNSKLKIKIVHDNNLEITKLYLKAVLIYCDCNNS